MSALTPLISGCKLCVSRRDVPFFFHLLSGVMFSVGLVSFLELALYGKVSAELFLSPVVAGLFVFFMLFAAIRAVFFWYACHGDVPAAKRVTAYYDDVVIAAAIGLFMQAPYRTGEPLEGLAMIAVVGLGTWLMVRMGRRILKR